MKQLDLERLPFGRGSFVLTLFPRAFVASFQAVPGEFYVHSQDRALVGCPCGRRPLIALGDLEVCEKLPAWLPTRAGCERVYFFGRRLHVASPYVARA